MPFCPQCTYEYNEGVETCPDCGSKLVQSLPEERNNQGYPDSGTASGKEQGITWVKLGTLPGRVYAEMLKEVLDKEGIPCFIKGSPLQAYQASGTELDNVNVLVPEDSRERAAELQKELFGDS